MLFWEVWGSLCVSRVFRMWEHHPRGNPDCVSHTPATLGHLKLYD